MKIVHAAETVKGGVATVIGLLATHQAAEFSPSNVICLIPDQHRSELAGSSSLIHTFRHTGRNVASLFDFTRQLAILVWQHSPTIVHLHSTFAGVAGRLLLLALRPFRSSQVIY